MEVAKVGAETVATAVVPQVGPARRTIAHPPLLTLSLLALLGVAFCLEQALPVHPERAPWSPDYSTLSVLGGLHGVFVFERGEWYRLFTSLWLHADVWHLLANAFALAVGAGALERRLGRHWAWALFFMGATLGGLFSLALNAPETVSVGASGAILCLLSAAFVLSFRGTASSGRRVQFWLVFALLPFVFQPLLLLTKAPHTFGIDFASHAGGALAGLTSGLFLVKTWRLREPTPPYLQFARAVGAAGLAAFAISACLVCAAYDSHVRDHSGSMRYTPPA